MPGKHNNPAPEANQPTRPPGASFVDGGVEQQIPVSQLEVVAPHFKRRLSGVTSTLIQVVPAQASKVAIACLGPGLPPTLPRMSWSQLPALWRKPAHRRFRIWHARRNIEMAAGILLKSGLRMPLKLVFTSAAQRSHKAFTRFLFRQMDAIIATSARSGSFLNVPHTVVMHGVDCTRFHPAQEPEDNWQAAGLPGRYAVGCFGRIRSQKGTDLFVDAMIQLLPRYPDWTAVISGRVTPEHIGYFRGLQSRIEAASLERRIVFLGEVPDITVWYRRISLHVSPSRNEGFGLTPLEAMASSTAVIASDAGAYPTLLADTEAGEIVQAGDGTALRSAIESFLVDPQRAHRCGQVGVSHVRKHFSIDIEADRINQIYDGIWTGNL